MKNVLFNGDRKMVKIYNQIIKEKKFGKFPSSSRLSSTNFFIAFKFTHYILYNLHGVIKKHLGREDSGIMVCTSENHLLANKTSRDNV